MLPKSGVLARVEALRQQIVKLSIGPVTNQFAFAIKDGDCR